MCSSINSFTLCVLVGEPVDVFSVGGSCVPPIVLTLASTATAAVTQSVYGKAEPGDMLALMGPSGAGKSTLMDILAGRKSVGNLTGSVLVNGRPRRKDEFARQTAYVPQVCAGGEEQH
eukprot:GHRQ01023833.1.p2 GENE.GHRQ01023833.1~~GHRQ01023833.1.p2  ORF type:complete len:118 (-),score=39.96 GHRQ01023833.1:895-1248(-)